MCRLPVVVLCNFIWDSRGRVRKKEVKSHPVEKMANLLTKMQTRGNKIQILLHCWKKLHVLKVKFTQTLQLRKAIFEKMLLVS